MHLTLQLGDLVLLVQVVLRLVVTFLVEGPIDELSILLLQLVQLLVDRLHFFSQSHLDGVALSKLAQLLRLHHKVLLYQVLHVHEVLNHSVHG